MTEFDRIISGGDVVTPAGVLRMDLGISKGKIAGGVHPGDSAREVVDATGLHIFPGGIDSHVHFNEPGHTDWETVANGSSALAAGGYTAFVDMPLNSLPVTIDAESFDAKLRALQASSIIDFGIWGGLVPGNLDQIEVLVERGVMGFKAFMCPSGLDEFPACDESTLREGMRRIAGVNSVLLVHAEDPSLISATTPRTTARDFIRSRPAAAEVEATRRIIALAAETGCRLHVVHVSTAEGIRLIQKARDEDLPVHGETCTHYLLYTEDDLERLGPVAKCAPPLRTAADRDALWGYVAEDPNAMVVSDHSPSAPELKRGDDFSSAWGGVAGCQTTRQLLLAEREHRSVRLETIANATAFNVALELGIDEKGKIGWGGDDADLWLVDLSHEDIVRRADLFYRHPISAHEGRPIRGRTVMTMVRGRTVFADGHPTGKPAGRFIRPAAGP